MDSKKEHWDGVYDSKDVASLGWYEETPKPSLDLFRDCDIGRNDLILEVGAGTSTFIDNIIDLGYRNIVATDISERALKKLRERLGGNASLVRWVVDDLTQPIHLQKLENVSVWHDRAVLHFLTGERERRAYLSILLNAVKSGGYVIIAAFSLKGVQKCSGLDVWRCNQNMLQDFLGDGFRLLKHFDHLYHTPSGESRPYIYTLFQRIRKG
jgi:SAM-dependent methyltransferase